MLIVDLQKFLTRGGDPGNRIVGEPIRFELNPAQYKPEMKRFIQIDEGLADKGRAPGEAPPGLLAEPVKTAQPDANGKLQFLFESGMNPGVHYFRLYPQANPGADPKSEARATDYEERWFAFNVDTANESNLRRVASEELARNPVDASPTRGKIEFLNMEKAQKKLREQKSDLSESPWLYLIVMLVLIVEQALAVHLSFHLKGGEGSSSASGTAAAPASATPRQQAKAAAAAAV